jgi:hypothetical protein
MLAAKEEQLQQAIAAANRRLPEPQSLLAARATAREAARKLNGLSRSAEQISESIDALNQPRTWWCRTIDWVTGRTARRQIQIAALEERQNRAELAAQQARKAAIESDRRVEVAEAQYREAARAYAEEWDREATEAHRQMAAIKAAAELWQLMPGVAALGFDALYRLGGSIAGRRDHEARQFTHDRRSGAVQPH